MHEVIFQVERAEEAGDAEAKSSRLRTRLELNIKVSDVG